VNFNAKKKKKKKKKKKRKEKAKSYMKNQCPSQSQLPIAQNVDAGLSRSGPDSLERSQISALTGRLVAV
jgi:hypothetical protein